jgi:hypothetical protein
VLQGQPGVRVCSRATAVRPAHIGCAYGPAVACGGPDPQPGMKGKRFLRNHRWMFQACVLGLPYKVEISVRIVRLSRGLRLLIPFTT